MGIIIWEGGVHVYNSLSPSIMDAKETCCVVSLWILVPLVSANSEIVEGSFDS
jgi:hypothetical protein